MQELTDVILGTFIDVAKMVRSLLSSRTTWLAAIGFTAIWLSSGKVEAFQQLLGFLGISGLWIIKIGVQNVVGIIKGNGKPALSVKPEVISVGMPQPEKRLEVPLPPVPPPAPEQPFDVEAFHKRVLNDAGIVYGELNPFTVFGEAVAKGSVTTCQGIKQAQDYWDYLVPLAYAARDYVKEETEKKQGVCKGVDAPEYVSMQHQLSRILRYRDNVYQLANIPWANLKNSLATNDTVYHVGVLSDDLLRANW